MKNLCQNVCVLLSVCLSLLPCAAGAAPQKPPFPPTASAPLSLPEKGPLPENAPVVALPVVVAGDKVIVSDESNDGQRHVDLVKGALTPFTEILRTYPHAHTVDLNWFDPVSMGVTGVDVLYNRRKHIVTVDYYFGGGDAPEYEGKVAFIGVRESVFAAILKAYPKGIPENDPVSEKIADAHGNNATDWGGFQFLYQPRYGCRVRVLETCRKMRM